MPCVLERSGKLPGTGIPRQSAFRRLGLEPGFRGGVEAFFLSPAFAHLTVSVADGGIERDHVLFGGERVHAELALEVFPFFKGAQGHCVHFIPDGPKLPDAGGGVVDELL